MNKGDEFIRRFAEQTGESADALAVDVRNYNQDFSAYGNEIYSTIGSRVAHWANFLNEGWFQRRLDLPLSRFSEYEMVADLGFSVPYGLELSSIRDGATNFLLVDNHASAATFFAQLVALNKWEKAAARCEVLTRDLSSEDGFEEFSKRLKARQAASVMLMASELIEHLVNPEQFLDRLKRLVKQLSAVTCDLYLTLPVGVLIPSHTIEFKTAEEADVWVSRFFPHRRSFVISTTDPTSPYLRSAYCCLIPLKQDSTDLM